MDSREESLKTFRRNPGKDAQERRFWESWLKDVGRYGHLLNMLEHVGDSQQATTILGWKADLQSTMDQWEELSGCKLQGRNKEEQHEHAGNEASNTEDKGAILGVGEGKPEAWRRPCADTPEDRTQGEQAGLPEQP